MRVKSLFIVMVLNAFLMLMTSVLMEYASLADRFGALENTFQVALDSSIGVATGAEEMFSDKFQATISSYASNTSGQEVTYATTLIWVGGKFHQVNSYALAKFYADNGRMPQTIGEVNMLPNVLGSDQLATIHAWLYGKAGNDYSDPSLSWANRNTKILDEASGDSPRPTPGQTGAAFVNQGFRNYYNYVGKYQKTVGYLKEKTGDSTYTLSLSTYPTLINMGFSWMDNLNRVTSDKTADNFTSVYHHGKSYRGVSNTLYYFTPASLGVTYIPVEVLKPMMIANLDTLARLNHVSGSNSDRLKAANLTEAGQCSTTSVYHNGMTTPAAHNVGSTEKIVSDGNIEYDLNSVKVRVEYFYVDFKQPSNKVLLSKLAGTVSAAQLHQYSTGNVMMTSSDNHESNLRNATFTLFNERDSAKQTNDPAWVNAYESVRGGRIVARVSARVKIHVPYRSSIMQWMCERSGNPGHYDIKLYDNTTGRVVNDSDGLWYEYTTYYMQSRV